MRNKALACAAPLLLLCLLLFADAAGAQQVIIEPGGAIAIAVLAALDESQYDFGIVSERGALLAQEARPALTIDGQQFAIELTAHDSACEAERAAAIAESLVEEGRAVAVIGPNCSTACLAAAPIFDEAGFTSLSPTCTATILTEQGFASFHRLISSDALLAERGARYLRRQLGGGRLALLFTTDRNREYYENLAAVIAAEFAALGGEIVSEAALQADTDHAALAADIARAEPDLLFCACAEEAAAALLALRADAGLARLPVMGAERDWLLRLLALAGADAESVYGISSGGAAPTAHRIALSERYQERFEAPPPSPYFTNAYDAYQLLLDAVLAVGALDEAGALHIERAALNAHIRATADYDGLSGLITCDENGECLRAPSTVYQIQDGALATMYTDED